MTNEGRRFLSSAPVMALLFVKDLRDLVITVLAIPLALIVLRRLRGLFTRIARYLMDALVWRWGRHIFSSLSRALSLRHYTTAQLEDATSKYLLVPGKAGVSLETDRIYVPLKLDLAGQQEAERLAHQWDGYRTFTLWGNRLRIVGDPGSGKSSLLKRMLRDECKAAEAKVPDAQLPILVELKSFLTGAVPKSGDAAADFAVSELRLRVTRVDGFEMGQLFDSSLEHNGLLVLLDGLDEVPAAILEETIRVVNELSRRLANVSPRSKVALTMRTQFHKDVRTKLDQEFPPVGYVKPFSPENIYRFLNQWPFADEKAARVSRIYSDLTDRPTLREMCSNPLVLAMYVANDQATSGATATPDTRTEFYSQVVEELLVARRGRQLAGAQLRALREARERVLGTLALENLADVNQPANSLSWRRALEVVTDVYQLSNEDEADARFREMARDTGLFTEEREGESFRFLHLTFCEFLAAVETVQGQSDGWQALLRSHGENLKNPKGATASRLAEVIPFTVALLPRVDRPGALEAIAVLEDRAVQARCFLETQAYDHVTWASFVQGEVDTIVGTPERAWDPYWLSRLHLLSVLLRDWAEWANHLGRGGSVLTLDSVFNRLVKTSQRRLLRLFSAYATQDAGAAFRLARAVGVDLVADASDLVYENCSNPPFLGLVIQAASSEELAVEKWSGVLAEAALRQPFVAAELHGLVSPQAYRVAAQAIPKRLRWSPLETWYGGRIVVRDRDFAVSIATSNRPESFLTDAFSIGTSAVRDRRLEAEVFPALNQLTKVRAPGALIHRRVLQAVGAIVAIAACAAAIAIFTQASGGELSRGTLAGLVALNGLSLAFAIGVSYPRYRAIVYSIATGLLMPIFGTLGSRRSIGKLAMRTMHRDLCQLVAIPKHEVPGVTWFRSMSRQRAVELLDSKQSSG